MANAKQKQEDWIDSRNEKYEIQNDLIEALHFHDHTQEFGSKEAMAFEENMALNARSVHDHQAEFLRGVEAAQGMDVDCHEDEETHYSLGSDLDQEKRRLPSTFCPLRATCRPTKKATGKRFATALPTYSTR